jgi:hypothetical protein
MSPAAISSGAPGSSISRAATLGGSVGDEESSREQLRITVDNATDQISVCNCPARGLRAWAAATGHRVLSFMGMKADLPDYSNRSEWRRSSKGRGVIFVLFVSA